MQKYVFIKEIYFLLFYNNLLSIKNLKKKYVLIKKNQKQEKNQNAG